MKIHLKEKSIVKKNTFYLLFFTIELLCLISLFTPTIARFKSESNANDKVRVSQFGVVVSTLEASDELVNEIFLSSDTEKKTINFSIENISETAIYVMLEVHKDDDQTSLPNFKFLTENTFYLMENESKTATLEIYGSESDYFFDIEEKLKVNILAEQAD